MRNGGAYKEWYLKEHLIRYWNRFIETVPGFLIIEADGTTRMATPEERLLLGKAKSMKDMQEIMESLK